MENLDLIRSLEFTFTKKLGSSAINYALVSEGTINNILV